MGTITAPSGRSRESVRLWGNDTQTVFLSITSGENGSHFYFNGVLQGSWPSLRLQWPNGGGQARLVVGNSIHGRHPWAVEITGLAVFEKALNAADVASLHAQWLEEGHFASFRQKRVNLLFPMAEGNGTVVHNHAGSITDLEVPPRMRILHKEVLMLPNRTWPYVDNKGLVALDVALNFFGFLPLGFFIASLLHVQNGSKAGTGRPPCFSAFC